MMVRAYADKMTRNAQASIEAALLITFMVLSLTIFLAIAGERLAETFEKKDKELVEDIAFVIESEIKLAAASEDGYFRRF